MILISVHNKVFYDPWDNAWTKSNQSTSIDLWSFLIQNLWTLEYHSTDILDYTSQALKDDI
jgi:hypothetical protein